MKKLLLIVLLAFSVNLSYSQVDTSKLTVKQVYTDVKEGFTKLVNNLEGPAKHVYGVYVKQHRTKGVSIGLATLFALIIGIITFSIVYRKNSKDFEDSNASDGQWVVTILSTIVMLVSVGFTIGYFAGDGFMKIINPEYYAIQDIIKAFK